MGVGKQKTRRLEKLKELGKLAVNVFSGKKGALEEFNEKAAESGFSPKAGVQKVEDPAVHMAVCELLREHSGRILESEGREDIGKTMHNLFISKFGKQTDDDYVDKAYNELESIAFSDAGELGTAALILTEITSLGGERLFEFINMLGRCRNRSDMEKKLLLAMQKWESDYDREDDTLLILHHAAETILRSEMAQSEPGLLLAFRCLGLDVVSHEEFTEFAELAAGKLAALPFDGSYSWESISHMYIDVLCKLKVIAHKDVTIDILNRFPDVIYGLLSDDKTMARSTLLCLEESINLEGTPELQRWWRIKKARIYELGRWGFDRKGRELNSFGEEKEISAAPSKPMSKTESTASDSDIWMEETHKGYVRKYSEAVSSGNFGVLEYDEKRIIYALVNYEDISNLGTNADGLILIARDKAVNQDGKEDVDLQKIVAVHEYVEAKMRKEGKEMEEAHDLAIKAQEEFVSKHRLNKRYNELLKRTGQIWSNGAKSSGE